MKFKVIKNAIYYFIFRLFFIRIRKEFVYLFYDKEGRAIMGRRYGNLWFLILIFLLTFLAIGFANGSLVYLKEKMGNPFISWLNIDIPSSKSEKIDNLINSLDTSQYDRKLYNYRFVTGYNFWSLNFYDLTKNKSRTFNGRTINVTDPLLGEILSDKFLIRGHGFSGNNDIGIVVTERLLRLLNYDKDEGFIAMDFSEDEVPRKILIPVIAVVKELPSLTDFLCTQHFYNQRIVNIKFGNAFSAENIRSVSFITPNGMTAADKFRKKIIELLSKNKELSNLELNFPRPIENDLSDIPFTQVDVTIYDDTSLRNRDKVFNAIMADPEIKSGNFRRFYDFYPNLSNDYNILMRFDRISIEFPNKDKIRDFKTFLSKKYDLNIELGQIEAMENYNFISKLTRIICIILMIFSILTISLFVSNLMQNHLEKIKMNIGTFLAFGIDSNSLERVYLSLIYMVILGSLFLGLFMAWFIGNVGVIRFVLFTLGQKLEENQSYYEQYSYWTIALILFVLVTSYFSISRITQKIFRQTPGDLLYERG